MIICALSAVLGLPAGAFAQSDPLPDEALRPLYATSADVADGKQLAGQFCAKCHGADGVSASKEVPNLASQRPVYVYLELKAYQRGDRAGGETHRVNFLNDEALANLAAYYASLDPAPPPGAPAPARVNAVAAGKAAAEPCSRCHGERGVSQKAGVPSLIGLHPKYLVESMKAYKEGDRPTDAKSEEMKKALAALSDEDLDHIARYYAAQSDNLMPAQTPNEGGAPLAENAITVCAKCHGDAGVSTSVVTPSLAGQDATYLLGALHAYKDGSRADDTMSPKAKKLSDEEMKSLAAYFAGLDPKPVVARPLSPAEWAEKCDRCHGVNGNSTRPEAPALAAQRPDYLEAVLKKYQSGARRSPEMAAMSSILTEDDIRGIAEHYAYQRGRPVVFILAPSK